MQRHSGAFVRWVLNGTQRDVCGAGLWWMHWLVPQEREFFIDNPLVRTHLIIEMILADRPCAMEV